MTNSKLSKQEIIFLVITSLILIIITSLPIIYGYFNRNDLYYNGMHIFSPMDAPVYLSYIQQVKQGNILLTDLFTTEPDMPALFNPFWLAVGMLAKIFNLAAPLAFHLARIILIPLFLFSLYKFISLFLSEYPVKRKMFCLAYSIFATGLGFFYTMYFGVNLLSSTDINLPMDLWVPESSNFLIMFSMPHFIASITLIILTFYFFFLALERRKISLILSAGMLALILFSFHPFFAATIYFVAFGYLACLFIKNKKIELDLILYFFCLMAISSPALLYYYYQLSTSLALQFKNIQNICITPGGQYFFASYGLGLIFAVSAIMYLAGEKKITNKNLFLIVWLIASVALIYSPLNFQRRLTEGLQIPLTLLAFMGFILLVDSLRQIWPILKRIKFWMIAPFFIILFCSSNIIVYLGDFRYIQAKPQVLYLPQEIKEALDWYQGQTTMGQTILASRYLSNAIPGQIGRRIFSGHGVETVADGWKEQQVYWFFKNNEDDQARQDFLESSQIDYLLFTAQEKQLGTFSPQTKKYLEEVFNNGTAAIYKVNLD
jgi:hypothetical protein